MRRSLGDVLKNAFEETTMKNMPIDQFRSLKCRNGAQNRNLCKKLSKIGPFGNFNFWSKVNAKVKVNKGQSQLVHGQSQQLQCLGRVTDWVAETLTSSYDVALTWIRAYMANDEACLHVIGSFRNFNFWLKVNTKVKVNKGQSQLV